MSVETFYPRPDQVRVVTPFGVGQLSLLATFLETGSLRVEIEKRSESSAPWVAVDAEFKARALATIGGRPDIMSREAKSSRDALIGALRKAVQAVAVEELARPS